MKHALTGLTDLPLASNGLISYRYRGDYGWIMIGARNNPDALTQAQRSLSSGAAAHKSRLQVWDGQHYVPVAEDQ